MTSPAQFHAILAAATLALVTSADRAATASTPPAPALSADYLVGKWSAFGEDCSHTIDFKKNGTVMTPIGVGKWKIGDGKLTVDYGDGSAPTTSAIRPLGPDRIEWTSSSGRKETEKRCK